MTDTQLSSTEIARKAKSNLAIALVCLPEERRRDMISFYAFCRVVDDIADDPAASEESKEKDLAFWRQCVSEGTAPGHPVLDEVVILPRKYGFPRAWLAEIIDGVASDITKVRYETIDDLLAYCYKVASVVGLVSVEIFGHKNPAARDYAVELGYALQLTNIIRDVGQDARETGRIYLPREDLKKFGVAEDDILHGNNHAAFQRMMEFQYQRAIGYYQKAAALLPPEDKESLIASQMMGQIYREILEKLKRTHYPVFNEARTRLHPIRKAWILIRYVGKGWLVQQRRRWLGR